MKMKHRVRTVVNKNSDFGQLCKASLHRVIFYAEASEANKVRAKIMDAVKRQSEQLVVAFLEAAANNERATVDRILDEGSIEVDDSDGVLLAVLLVSSRK